MPCETTMKSGQTLTERKLEVREAIAKLSAALVSGAAKAVIGPQGAIAFAGWTNEARNGVTDLCGYRLIMATGTALAKQAIARAEQLAGRTVNRQAVAHGIHSHDGGATFHPGHRHHH